MASNFRIERVLKSCGGIANGKRISDKSKLIMIHECKRINYEIFIYIIYLDVDYFQRGLVFVVDIFVKFRYHNPPPL